MSNFSIKKEYCFLVLIFVSFISRSFATDLTSNPEESLKYLAQFKIHVNVATLSPYDQCQSYQTIFLASEIQKLDVEAKDNLSYELSKYSSTQIEPTQILAKRVGSETILLGPNGLKKVLASSMASVPMEAPRPGTLVGVKTQTDFKSRSSWISIYPRATDDFITRTIAQVKDEGLWRLIESVNDRLYKKGFYDGSVELVSKEEVQEINCGELIDANQFLDTIWD